ncbi:MAG: PQQ-binding-like beta-propeller repeat protein [Fibrobacter sp.]|nr:PQQ-binding-like beta-propeller repeat protein [Fibrobacter sp.]
MNKKHNVIANMQGVIASMAKQSLACIAVASLAFGLSACGDDSSSASSNEPEVSLTGVFFASDYTTGELRWIDKEGKVSEKKLSFYQDSRVAVNGADLFVMEGLSKDNIVLVDPEKLETDGEKAVVWQVSLDDDTNPIDMAFDGDKAWVALQNADSLIHISTKDGKILKSIKTGTFSNGEEKSPYVADIALDDGKLYAVFARYDAMWMYPNGLLAIYDASTGELQDTIQLLTHNPKNVIVSDGNVFVATQGDYNMNGATDADENRGLEKINLEKKTSTLFVSGQTLGGGIYQLAAEDGVAYACVLKTWGAQLLVKIDLATGKTETVKGVPDPEFVAVKDGVVYAADRTFESEKLYVVKDGKATALDQPKGAIAPYNIALF